MCRKTTSSLKGALVVGPRGRLIPAGLEELFCRDVRHLASSKGKDGESRMKEVRSWNVLGLLPGSKFNEHS